MFPEAIRAVRELKPKAFIFENVKGLTRATFATYLKYIELQMSYPELVARAGEDWAEHFGRLERHHTPARDGGLTYRVLWRVLNAANFGVPQKRERVFFVGFRADLGIEWTFPSATHSQDALFWDQLHGDYWDRHEVPKRDRWADTGQMARASRLEAKPDGEAWRTIRDALAGLPDPEKKPEASRAFLNHHFQPGARSYVGHTGSPIDEPAKTLKAGVHGVPGGENMMRRPDGSVRYFTVRESARLQTFPDTFAFHGSWSESMRQLGNAVPVKLAEVIAKDVFAHLSAL
jgi:DNA (cytosine-5)-methyltransferase 1